MNRQTLESGLTTMAFSRDMLVSFAEDIPDDKLCFQPFPGANHAIWTLGHLAWADDYFVRLGGRAGGLPAGWADAVQWGSTPKADRSIYPPRSEVMEQLAASREALTAWLRSLTEAQLIAPLPDETKRFAANFAALPASIAWHEGFHAGQIAVIRKALGLKPKFV